ncbi:MAG: class I SAM-dependent methyltransferase [Anaerolineae bacterium]|nr:class I SAM-dependent methyltransferase [Anaerolineae bacterium]
MDAATIHRLNQINRQFYQTTADDFDQTRGTAWPGWNRLLPYLTTPLEVLDVGCGNGRFGAFLAKALPVTRRQLPDKSDQQSENKPSDSELEANNAVLSYHGIDSSAALLAHAQKILTALPNIRFRLEERDVIEHPPDTDVYDLVVLLGVLHHIPGWEQRQTFMRQLAARVKPGGLLVFAAWRFYEYKRFRSRVVDWPDDIAVEAGDYLLDWRRGTVSLRYCHYTDDAEHDTLVGATGMTEIATYRADGESGDANRYSILRK